MRGAAWERPVEGNGVSLTVFVRLVLRWRRALGTYGSRDCCRRRRVRASRGAGIGCGIARVIAGLRFRIGCARRRMSRRGGCGRAFG